MRLAFGYCEGQVTLADGSTIEFLPRCWLAAAQGLISSSIMDAATYS